MLRHQFVLATQIIALIVGVQVTLLKNAPRPGNQIKVKVLVRITKTRGRVNFTTLTELPEGASVMLGTFSIHNKPVVILFDSGASHSFISPKFGAKLGLDFSHTKGS
jgi:hypothetical protein